MSQRVTDRPVDWRELLGKHEAQPPAPHLFRWAPLRRLPRWEVHHPILADYVWTFTRAGALRAAAELEGRALKEFPQSPGRGEAVVVRRSS